MALKPGQQKCIETLDAPLAVAAGAGSGKTFTVTQRIAGALESGYVTDIDQVLAITFTNKAAAELKSRLKSELRARGLVDQALKVDEAWVSTIHGMCARLLRAHALELGIDPAFKVADQAQLDAFLTSAINAVVKESEQLDDVSALDALFAEYPARTNGFGVSVEGMLNSLVTAALATGKGIHGIVLGPIGPHPVFALQEIVDSFQALIDEASSLKQSKSSAEWVDSSARAIEAARMVLEQPESSAESVFQALCAFETKRTFGSAEFKERMSEAAAGLSQALLAARLYIARNHMDTLVVMAEQVMELYAESKRIEGVLDNTDLLTLASLALEQNPDIAALYVDKFRLVMVDEFQDTDQMQVDMIKRLAGKGFARLCVVGDAQQSIYRFRGADVSVYQRHLKAVVEQKPDGIIELPDNFRSHADVLAFVDRIFEQPSMFGGSFMSLKASREQNDESWEHANLPRITVQLNARPYRGGDKHLASSLGPKRVARALAQFAETHSAGDMAVLLGGMRRAAEYAQALRAEGLTCVISGGSVFAQTIEAQMVLDLVHLCANPHDTNALFNVLAGPMFCLTADDLLQLGTRADAPARCGLDMGLSRAERLLSEQEHADISMQLECAVRVLSDLRRSCITMPVAFSIERAVVDSGWLSRMQDGGAVGQSQAANVYKALRMVSQLETDEALGCAALSKRFEAVLSQSKEAPGALSASGGDFVRIMTVHASKGLEFPVVAVAEFRESRSVASKLQLTSIDGAVHASLDLDRSIPKNCASKGRVADVAASLFGDGVDDDQVVHAAVSANDPATRAAALYEFDARGDEEESKRLLYVALTRAREALVVSMEGKWSSRSNPSGNPSNVFSSIVTALDPVNGCFAPGRTYYDFKGSAPALVEVVKLPAGEDEAEDADNVLFDLLVPNALASNSNGGQPSFAVPVPDRRSGIARIPVRLGRSGVFSYSSISDASHGTSVLADLATRYFTGADEASEPDERDTFDELQAMQTDALSFTWEMPAAFDVDDESIFNAPGSPDADKATDLGTAFHRLAQYAVIARPKNERLERPSLQRVQALAKTCGLGEQARARLEEALDRWFGSSVAESMSAFEDLRAEVPFYARIDDAGLVQPIYLEGEIDLLAFDPDSGCAHVVDYKTGGSAAETVEQLAEKHVLQAACYAYALIRNGVAGVDAVFVRVERRSAGFGNEPQCVRYHFDSTDLPVLEKAIVAAKALA